MFDQLECDIKRNLCDDCINTYPDCGAYKVDFGTGKGHDNIYKCSGFKEECKTDDPRYQGFPV
jgi:hypothetical protein